MSIVLFHLLSKQQTIFDGKSESKKVPGRLVLQQSLCKVTFRNKGFMEKGLTL